MAIANRIPQIVLIASTLLLSWLGMMLLHECGHVLGALVTGGRVVRVVLHPLVISRTDVSPNPHPLIVAWAGPVFGAVVPVVGWFAAAACRVSAAFVVRFFAGFCLLANGAYIGIGSFDRVGDAGDLLRLGAAAWQLWLFGSFMPPAGLLLWHRLGPSFGLGDAAGRVNPCIAYACCWACYFW